MYARISHVFINEIILLYHNIGDEYDIVILRTVRSLPINEIKDSKFV